MYFLRVANRFFIQFNCNGPRMQYKSPLNDLKKVTTANVVQLSNTSFCPNLRPRGFWKTSASRCTPLGVNFQKILACFILCRILYFTCFYLQRCVCCLSVIQSVTHGTVLDEQVLSFPVLLPFIIIIYLLTWISFRLDAPSVNLKVSVTEFLTSFRSFIFIMCAS